MIEKKCIYCGKKFNVSDYRNNTAFYCSRDCFKKNKGLIRKVIKKCPICEKVFKLKLTGAEKYCSSKCSRLMRIKQWKDKQDIFRFGISRKVILEKYNYKCAKCSASFGTKLHIHHKDGMGRFTKNPNNDINNLEVLCNSCHQKEEWKHRMSGKWSLFFNKCQRCSTTIIPHNAKGYCKKCYKILFR